MSTNTIVKIKNLIGTPVNIGSTITIPGSGKFLIWDTISYNQAAIVTFEQLLNDLQISVILFFTLFSFMRKF
jgi:hypothetical protein